MNLATAKSQKNSKEVGINKVLGASRKQIIIRFYIETATISLIAMAIGIFLAILLLPLFNAISQNDIAISHILNWQNVSPVFIAWLSITLIAGSYPALYLSQIKSITLMKKVIIMGQKSINKTAIGSVSICDIYYPHHWHHHYAFANELCQK